MKLINLWLFIISVCYMENVAGQAPANDRFADSLPISGLSGSVLGSNLNAGLESGESTSPEVDSRTAVKSVWYKWTAPSTGPFTFSLTPNFEAQLVIYTGHALNSLILLGASDTNTEPGKLNVVELISLSAVQGQEYRVRVTGRSTITGSAPDSGSFTLGWRLPPANDNYANAEVLNLAPGTTTVLSSNAGATGEVGETDFEFLILQRRSVWYRISVPVGASLSLSTEGSTFDTFVSVFRQTSPGLSGLEAVYGNDNAPGVTFSRVSFVTTDVPGDGDFYIALDGVNSDAGNFKLTFTMIKYERVVGFAESEIADLPNKGSSSKARLVEGNDGNFYGTTFVGGVNDHGTVFRMSRSGLLTTLVDFTDIGGPNRGKNPAVGLLRGRDGNFYGTTRGGGALGFGTVFKMTPAGLLTTLVEFTDNGTSNKGKFPEAELIQGTDGDIYGTTTSGGTNTFGTVFKMTQFGGLATLVNFSGNGATNKGRSPQGGLVQDSDGSFYGTTAFGGTGALDNGTIFKITPVGMLTTLVEFTGISGSKKGRMPGGLIRAADGSFYGMTSAGGISDSSVPEGKGTVFKMITNGTPGGTIVSTLVEFTGNGVTNRGAAPIGNLVINNGDFYGTTSSGGLNSQGTLFQVTPGGLLTTLIDLTLNGASNDGAAPRAGLVVGSDGVFYGTSSSGGENQNGTIFKMVTNGTPSGTTLTTLVKFNGRGVSNKGRDPIGALVRDGAGNFYGTASKGGSFGGSSGFGTIFKLSPAGVLTKLVDFTGNGATNRGSDPRSALIEGGGGNFYGTTFAGGANSFGTVFKMTPAGVLTTLVDFTGPAGIARGAGPIGSLLVGDDSHFYGTTSTGGEFGFGTVFKMSTNGTIAGTTLTTLVDFTRNGGTNKGAYPNGALVKDSIGNFYGTTPFGGMPDLGTVFKMITNGTPGGTTLSTLVEFTGNGVNSKGARPYAGLVKGIGNDNHFYGTTFSGGIFDLGTVFRIPPTGPLATLVSFGADPARMQNREIQGSRPRASLVVGTDGNFYGTNSFVQTKIVVGNTTNIVSADEATVFQLTPSGSLSIYPLPGTVKLAESSALTFGADGNPYATSLESGGSSGSIYRLIFPGAPTIYQLDEPRVLDSTSVVLTASVNARGAATTVTLEYWTGGDNPPNPLPNAPVPIGSVLDGYATQLFGTTLGGLISGETYFYRFRAMSTSETEFSEVVSFSTLAAPAVNALAADTITTSSARFNGTVNARNYSTTASFQWGTDGSNFPNSTQAMPGTVVGNLPIPVSAFVPDLTQGVTYFYRLVATNAGGTAVSSSQSFTTLSEPVATLGSASALSTTRAQVNGFVNPRGTGANVSFEYGTDESHFPNSFSAVPASFSGNNPVAVMATLTGLQQGTTYWYRIRAVGAGGTGLSNAKPFSLSILSGLAQIFPDLPPPSNGTVIVNFDPPTQGAWRFAGETAWRNSGIAAGQLASGPRLIEFLPQAGRISPPSEILDVVSGTSIVLNRIYFETTTAGSGGLTVRLKPEEFAALQVPQAVRAQWRFVGESLWRDSDGSSISNLTAGSYLVECKPVVGKVTPPRASVTIINGNSREITLTYFTANSTGTAAPQPLPFDSVSANEDLPYAYVGQVRTPVGSSTGFVVKRRVVATAGHVVFDDGTLSFISGMQWLFQRHTGQYEPKPQVPRGNYLAAGYASQRIADSSPGQGSAQSQTLDYAALYFLEEAGRGGYGGFLASDAGDDNEFLTSSAQKILAGFAVDGIPATDEGKLHATTAFIAALTPAFGETWISTSVRGFGGMSGGPLFVQRPNGSFLPAAIYLGGNGQTVVRAIDSSVVELFNRAEISGNGGDNNTSGGITRSDISTIGTASDTGAIRITILPAAAASTARWGLKGESTNRNSGTTSSGRSGGDYILQFTTVSGFQAPTSQAVRINGGQLTEITFNYVTGSPLDAWRQANFQTTSNTGDAADGFDPDKDGQTNLSEYAAGTNPNSAADVFKVLTSTKNATTFTVTAAGRAARSYVLERNTTLNLGAWTTVQSIGPLSADGFISLFDPAPPNKSAFYRLRVSAH